MLSSLPLLSLKGQFSEGIVQSKTGVINTHQGISSVIYISALE